MPLKGLNWLEAEITNTNAAELGWYQRSISSTWASDWNFIANRKNDWMANKAADRYNNAFFGGSNQRYPVDQGGKWDPRNAAEKKLAAAFYALVKSYSSNPSEVTSANLLKRAVIDETINNVINREHTYKTSTFTETLKTFDFAGTPNRWVLGGMADVNPSFIIPQWLSRELKAWDYVKDQATPGEEATFRIWIKAGATLVNSYAEQGFRTLFASRTGEPGTYPISSAFANEQLTGQKVVNGQVQIANLIHRFGKRAHAINRRYNNRYRDELMFVGMAGLYLDHQPFIDAAVLFVKEYWAYGVYPEDDYHVDTQRSHDLKTDGTIKASQGYSYPQIPDMITFVDAYHRSGRTGIYEYSTNKGTTTANSGPNGNSSDGVTQKNMTTYLLNLKRIHSGEANYYSPVSPYPRIGPINNDGEEIVTYYSWNVANLYLKNAELRTFLQRPRPGNPAPAGPTDVRTVGGFPNTLFMYSGYPLNPTLNRFAVENVPDDPDTPKQANPIAFPDPPDRVFVPNEIITFAATAPGGIVVYEVVEGLGTIVEAVLGHNNQVRVIGTGIFKVTATQAGSDTYLAATPQSNRVKISPANQAINASAIPDVQVGTTFNAPATASSGLAVTASVSAGLTKVDDDTFTATAVGQSTITYNQAGNANYNAAPPFQRMVTITAVPDPGDPTPPTVTVIKDNDDIIPKTSLPKNSPTGWFQKILGTGGRYYYRFRVFLTPFSSPAVPTGLILDSGRQGALTATAIKNNKIQSYRVYVKETSGSTPVLWLEDNQTQSEHIERGIPITDSVNGPGLDSAYQVYLEFDSQDPYARVQNIQVKGYYLS